MNKDILVFYLNLSHLFKSEKKVKFETILNNLVHEYGNYKVIVIEVFDQPTKVELLSHNNNIQSIIEYKNKLKKIKRKLKRKNYAKDVKLI